eukprot:435234_1
MATLLHALLVLDLFCAVDVFAKHFECINLGDQIFLCHEEEFICGAYEDCSLQCLGSRACYKSTIYCPIHLKCTVHAPAFERAYQNLHGQAMAESNIFGAASEVLNIQMDSDRAIIKGHITCPLNGVCNINSLRQANQNSSSHVFSSAIINGQTSTVLNITIHGIDSPLSHTKIYCPTPSKALIETNCIIDVSNGKALFNATEIYVNQYTNLHITAHNGICDHDRCIHQVMVYKDMDDESTETCQCTLIGDTSHTWNCINLLLATQCSIPRITIDIPIVTDATAIQTTVVRQYTSSVNPETKPNGENASSNVVIVVNVVLMIAICCVSVVTIVICVLYRSPTLQERLKRHSLKNEHAYGTKSQDGAVPPNDVDTEDEINDSNLNDVDVIIISVDPQLDFTAADKKYLTDTQKKARQITAGIYFSKAQKKEYAITRGRDAGDEKVKILNKQGKEEIESDYEDRGGPVQRTAMGYHVSTVSVPESLRVQANSVPGSMQVQLSEFNIEPRNSKKQTSGKDAIYISDMI